MKFKVDNPNLYLKKLRLEKKIKIKQVAELTGLSMGYISRIENGSSNITKVTLEKLCNVYSVSINEIIENESEDISNSNNIDLVSYISNNEVFFKDKKIFLNDKIAIIEFIDFITSVDDYSIKESCMNIIKSAKEIYNAKGEK